MVVFAASSMKEWILRNCFPHSVDRYCLVWLVYGGFSLLRFLSLSPVFLWLVNEIYEIFVASDRSSPARYSHTVDTHIRQSCELEETKTQHRKKQKKTGSGWVEESKQAKNIRTKIDLSLVKARELRLDAASNRVYDLRRIINADSCIYAEQRERERWMYGDFRLSLMSSLTLWA